MMRLRILAVVVSTMALAACGGSGGDDLQKWMADQNKAIVPKIVPIAEPKVFEPQPYAQVAAVDPFDKEKLAQALKRDGG